MATKDKGKAVVEKQSKALERLEVQYVPVDSINPNEYNPNRQSDHDFELLLRSMREDGFTQPVVCLRESRVIVDGEHRWRAAHALGYEEIPVVFVDMTPEQARIATLRHNRARGSEDIELAAAVLRDLQQLGALEWAQDSLMLDDTELERILEDISAPDALAAEEFGQAWEPSASPVGEDEPKSVETAVVATPQGAAMSAMSHQALEATRKREQAMAQARTAEEREVIRKEAASFFRLMLVLQGDEADLVKHVLGAQAAEKLVAICNEWVQSHPEDAPPAKATAEA